MNVIKWPNQNSLSQPGIHNEKSRGWQVLLLVPGLRTSGLRPPHFSGPLPHGGWRGFSSSNQVPFVGRKKEDVSRTYLQLVHLSYENLLQKFDLTTLFMSHWPVFVTWPLPPFAREIRTLSSSAKYAPPIQSENIEYCTCNDQPLPLRYIILPVVGHIAEETLFILLLGL